MAVCEHVRVDLQRNRTWKCGACPVRFVPVSELLRDAFQAATPHREESPSAE